MSATVPPPVPPSPSESGAKPADRFGFCYPAARWSLYLPVMTWLLTIALAFGIKALKNPELETLLTVLGGIVVSIAVVVAVGLSVFGLLGGAKYRSWGLAGFSLSGLAISAPLIVICVVNFIRSAYIPVEARGTRGQILIGAPDAEARKRRAMQTVSPRNAPMDPQLARALNARRQTLEGLMNSHTAAARSLQTPPVLDLSAVKNTADLAARKERVRTFITANEKVMTFVVHDEKMQRESLEKQKLPHATLENVMKGYHDAILAEQELQIKVRETDRRIGIALLGMLDVLEENWGRWKYNVERKKVEFDDPATADRFTHFRSHMDTATAEGKKWQVRLNALPNS